ncbi:MULTISPECIES: hypothetical protein [Flavobacterium]|uniref:Uncharacterized protein n=2 Tax=Flavobacterium TaxID=237 RepID=A0A940XAV5_9FLAO|nr:MULTISPECIES: hypothetical protein [Flavobacterium]MBP4138591.1 hypothetical protein [Flavobacterium geliluteum]MDX6183438.1 hypothetical protein [Flavobacterium sp. Fl-33]MDX6186722.1 hypothetical protein [Flavobacterium sp. Fl-77]UFH38510.1 hypothetical protein LNP22_17510 [Flavobacterium sp. F-70]
MKTIYILLFLFLSPLNIIETQVYICGQTGAKKYHYNESCRGLSSCKHGTFKTSLSQAKNYGLTLCGWED